MGVRRALHHRRHLALSVAARLQMVEGGHHHAAACWSGCTASALGPRWRGASRAAYRKTRSTAGRRRAARATKRALPLQQRVHRRARRPHDWNEGRMADDQSQTRPSTIYAGTARPWTRVRNCRSRRKHARHPRRHGVRDHRDPSRAAWNAGRSNSTVREGHALPDVPPRARAAYAAYLHIHSGGFLIGAPEMSDPMNVLVASKLGPSCSRWTGPRARTPCACRHRRCFLGLAWLHRKPRISA